MQDFSDAKCSNCGRPPRLHRATSHGGPIPAVLGLNGVILLPVSHAFKFNPGNAG